MDSRPREEHGCCHSATAWDIQGLSYSFELTFGVDGSRFTFQNKDGDSQMFSIERDPTGTIRISRCDDGASLPENSRNVLCVEGVAVFRRQTIVAEGRVGVYTTRDDSKFCFVDLTTNSSEVVTKFNSPRSGEVGKMLELQDGACLFEDKFPWYKTREEDEKFVIESIVWKDSELPKSLMTWKRWLNNESYSTPEMDVEDIDESVRCKDLPAPQSTLLSWNPFGTFT